MKKKTRKTNKGKGCSFENKVRKSIMSGALSTDPLDLSVGDKVIECKYTDKASYRITKELLEKAWNEALDMQKTPYLVIGIPKDDNTLFIVKCEISLERRQNNS